MGKSFANFMCKKFFHPASYANIKRVWMAEQRTDAEKKKQEGLRAEYEREQDTYTNRQLMGDVRVKHGLNFMYEPPKGMKTEEKEDGDQEFKFEWQRGAPREGYSKDMEVTDQPFGITVRNVKCIRCHKWGHVNTDRECPMFDQTKEDEIAGPSTDRSDLMDDMRRDGLALKQNVLGRRVNEEAKNQKFVGSSDDEEDDDMEPEEAFLKSLSMKEKIKLLKKLDKMEKKQKRLDSKSSKKQKDKKKMKKRKASHSSDESESSPDERRDRRSENRKKHNGKSRKRQYSDSESESEEDQKMKSRRKRQFSDSESDSEDNRRKKSGSSRRDARRMIKQEPESDDEGRRKSRKEGRGEDRKIKREPQNDSDERRHKKSSRREDNDSHRDRKMKIKAERRSRSPDSPSHDRYSRNGKDMKIRDQILDDDEDVDRRRNGKQSHFSSRRYDDRNGGKSSRNSHDDMKSRHDHERDRSHRDHKDNKRDHRNERDRDHHRHGDHEERYKEGVRR